MSKITLKALRALKGQRQLTIINSNSPDIAEACAESGVDILVVGRRQPVELTQASLRDICPVAGDMLITAVMPISSCKISDESAIRDAVALMESGADLVYTTGAQPDRMAKLAKQYIPCVGHLGLIPYQCSWTGGYRAMGKTAEEAKQLWEKAQELQDAGVICAELECISRQLAAYISAHVDYLTYSMGSGNGCDGQYLFASDILGSHNSHYPRHCKKYDDFYGRSVTAFKSFVDDVASGAYPEDKHCISMSDAELEAFLSEAAAT